MAASSALAQSTEGLRASLRATQSDSGCGPKRSAISRSRWLK
ncbi:Uncharacterised protein [Vibrio cholerae]|nr:Uncharacterised protein [Vibrio cholerae]